MTTEKKDNKMKYQKIFGISYLTNCPSPSSSRQFGLRSYLGLRLLYILPYTLCYGFAYAFHHVIIKRKQNKKTKMNEIT